MPNSRYVFFCPTPIPEVVGSRGLTKTYSPRKNYCRIGIFPQSEILLNRRMIKALNGPSDLAGMSLGANSHARGRLRSNYDPPGLRKVPEEQHIFWGIFGLFGKKQGDGIFFCFSVNDNIIQEMGFLRTGRWRTV